MREVYLVKEMTKNVTLGLYGTKNGVLFAIGNYCNIPDMRPRYSSLCKALRQCGIWSLFIMKWEFQVVAYRINEDRFGGGDGS